MAEGNSVAIALERVTKRFGKTAAVDDVSLSIGDGEFFSLLGPSGCGKTTTLRMIAGFEQPDEGRILLQGDDVTTVPPSRRPLNMVFQQYALFPHMSIYDNVAFGLRVSRVPRAEHRERIEKMLRVVELEGFEKRRIRQLSGGQQQRVALARALVKEPAALLLDEPLGALDVKLRKQMQHELKRIQAELGTTFVYVTHDQEEALAMSDRIAVMNGGRVEQIGSPREIYERPADAVRRRLHRLAEHARPAGGRAGRQLRDDARGGGRATRRPDRGRRQAGRLAADRRPPRAGTDRPARRKPSRTADHV